METKEFIEKSEEIVHRAPCYVAAGGKMYAVRQISNTVRTRISDLEKEVYLIEEKCKDKTLPLRLARRYDRKMRTLHSKTAAYYLLNNKALFIPFLWAVTWRVLDARDSEHTFRINEAGMNNRGLDFFLANWQITKAQLALSTRLVGEGVQQYQERMESVENMLDADASEVKTDSK